MSTRFTVLAGIALTMTATGAAVGSACELRSSMTRVPIVELYTSQGCDSCPAADRWLSSLAERGLGLDRLIPMARHVDYWDRLGWRDPFADARHTQRQKLFAARTRTSVVYTPQFVLNGKDARGLLSGDAFARRVAELRALPAGADLALTARIQGLQLEINGTITLLDAPSAHQADAHLVLLENGLETAVRAGENRGRRLRNDFVVRAASGPIALPTTGTLPIAHKLAVPAAARKADLVIAAFVEDRRSGEVHQAVARAGCL